MFITFLKRPVKIKCNVKVITYSALKPLGNVCEQQLYILLLKMLAKHVQGIAGTSFIPYHLPLIEMISTQMRINIIFTCD